MLTTQRLLLRPFQEGDGPALFSYLAHPTVDCFLDMATPTLADAEAQVKRRAQLGDLYFAITLRDTGRVIGEIGCEPEETEEGVYSPLWMLEPSCQGQGYAYEAAKAYFDYLFYRKGARRIYIYTAEDNLPCQRLCQRLGMRREGLFLDFVSFVDNPDGTPKYENTVQFAVLRREWPAPGEPTAPSSGA